MKTMELVIFSKGVPVVIKYDEQDHDTISGYAWYIDYYGYARAQIDKRAVHMHRLILGLKKGDGVVVDHKNRIKTDNTRANLRLCTQRDNARNKCGPKWSKCKYLGVSYMRKKTKDTNKIYIFSQIKVGGKNYFLGTFKTEEAAAMAYNEAAKKHFGEFANLNVIPQAL